VAETLAQKKLVNISKSQAQITVRPDVSSRPASSSICLLLSFFFLLVLCDVHVLYDLPEKALSLPLSMLPPRAATSHSVPAPPHHPILLHTYIPTGHPRGVGHGREPHCYGDGRRAAARSPSFLFLLLPLNPFFFSPFPMYNLWSVGHPRDLEHGREPYRDGDGRRAADPRVWGQAADEHRGLCAADAQRPGREQDALQGREGALRQDGEWRLIV
jgi:hypothetical protein